MISIKVYLFHICLLRKKNCYSTCWTKWRNKTERDVKDVVYIMQKMWRCVRHTSHDDFNAHKKLQNLEGVYGMWWRDCVEEVVEAVLCKQR